jgi:uncharacterized hydrophobic protein (TIGR00341 family)
MALRLIEVFFPSNQKDQLHNLLKDRQIVDSWQQQLSGARTLARLLVPSEETGPILDLLEKHFSLMGTKDFRIILLSVEASIPRPQPEEVPAKNKEPQPEEKVEKKRAGISREELYADIQGGARLSGVFVVLILLSSVVAAIGLLRDNVVIIIGAMVIAPLLDPNVALSLATTLGDIKLARGAMKTNVVGVAAALSLSILIGLVMKVNLAIPQIVSRTTVGLGDIVIALAAGSAAALSLTTGALSALIGVMVAVALLPPLVTLGMLIGEGQWEMAVGAMLLLLTNLICINLAGVVTFLARGIRPLTWWEADRAKKATREAITLWTFLLLILIFVIVLSQRG